MRSFDFIASLQMLSSIKPLETAPLAGKESLLAAEVGLPLAPGCCVDGLRLVSVREPYSSAPRPLVVDVSRLSAP
mgnify:CR=1 FL=1